MNSKLVIRVETERYRAFGDQKKYFKEILWNSVKCWQHCMFLAF